MTPIMRGEPFTVPKGTTVHSMHPKQPTLRQLGRTMTVRPYFVDRYEQDDGSFKTIVTWAGTGGYWQRVALVEGEFIQP